MSLNHIFWWVAGADIEHLKQCPSDQKRIGAIGMVIMTTAFVAFIAGTAAATFFTMDTEHPNGQPGWALAFGLLWMLIIFMIDRSLVVTMKKNPTLSNQFKVVIGPFIFRMFLSGIIALMISIPLELFIFRDFIKTSTIEYNNIEKKAVQEDSPETGQISNNQSSIDKASNRVAKYQKDEEGLESEISNLINIISSKESQKNKPNTPAFQESQKRYNGYVAQKNTLKSTEMSSQSQISSIESKIRHEQSIMAQEKTKWNTKIDNEIAPLKAKLTEKESQLQDIKKSIGNENQRIDSLEVVNSEYQQAVDIRINTQDSLQQNTGHFFRDYQILSNTITNRNEDGTYKHPMELLFYWLVRIIFFLIELLPTLVKVITPVGAYDRLVYHEEQALMQLFSSYEFQKKIQQIQDDRKQFEIDLQNQQLAAEKVNKAEMLELVRKNQLEVVKAIIEQWKQNEMSKITPIAPASKSAINQENMREAVNNTNNNVIENSDMWD